METHDKSCKKLWEFTKDRSVWHGALAGTLVGLPLLPLSRQIDLLPCEKLKKCALAASRLEHAWHQENLVPRSQFKPRIDPRAHSVKILPGGEWLVVVTRDLLLRLICIDEQREDVVVPLKARNSRLVLRAVTQLFYSSSHETLLLVRTASSVRLVSFS